MQNIVPVVDKNAKIAVLCGGMSSEAEVSRRSGSGCYEALKRLGYANAELVEVDKDIALKLKNGKYDYYAAYGINCFRGVPDSRCAYGFIAACYSDCVCDTGCKELQRNDDFICYILFKYILLYGMMTAW